MKHGRWLTAKDVLRVNAHRWPHKIGIKDLYKSYTFQEWNNRSCALANGLSDLGLVKGDRFAVLAYNCVEWMEIYAAAAKGGFVCVPLMFRLASSEMEYVINHSGAKAIIVQGGRDRDGKEFPWLSRVNKMRKKLPLVEHYISFAVGMEAHDDFIPYEGLIARATLEEPPVEVHSDDLWVIMYTGGTTGRPKGVMKTHASLCAEYLITIYEQQFAFDDANLLVMPCCHVNSLYYSFVVTWVGGTVMVYNMVSFNPEDLLRTLTDHRITFTSLVPTHYIMMLALPDTIKKKYDITSIKQLLISSAPARRETKLGILEMFQGVRLYEAYGSTEAGIVTILKPEEQMTKLGTIGREVIGSDLIRLYDEDGNLVTETDVVGELYSRSPMLFEGYWKEPEKTEAAMRGEYFSAGDMAYRDLDGYYVLVDRKANMIISGGENIYPSEVEGVIKTHPLVKDVGVIGIPHEKWGEQVVAIVVLQHGQKTAPEEITAHCKGRIADFKIPKEIIFVSDREMPRDSAKKILYRMLREKYPVWKSRQ